MICTHKSVEIFVVKRLFVGIPEVQYRLFDVYLDTFMISINVMFQVKLNGLLHSDNNCALKVKSPLFHILVILSLHIFF